MHFLVNSCPSSGDRIKEYGHHMGEITPQIIPCRVQGVRLLTHVAPEASGPMSCASHKARNHPSPAFPGPAGLSNRFSESGSGPTLPNLHPPDHRPIAPCHHPGARGVPSPVTPRTYRLLLLPPDRPMDGTAGWAGELQCPSSGRSPGCWFDLQCVFHLKTLTPSRPGR